MNLQSTMSLVITYLTFDFNKQIKQLLYQLSQLLSILFQTLSGTLLAGGTGVLEHPNFEVR